VLVAALPSGLLRLVTQPDHAHFAARLLALVRAPELVAHPRREELLAAVRRHDDGWQGPDAAPRVEARTGRPLRFADVPQGLRQETWRDGSRRHAERHPYSALLATHHALVLHAGRAGEPAWDAFLADLGALEEELLARCGLDEAALAADYRWLDLADLLSLVACERWPGVHERGGVRAELAGDELRLAPFPLAGATTLAVACREVPDRRYAGDGDLAVELAAAPWRRQAVRVVPSPG
jgi:hypothetical protein